MSKKKEAHRRAQRAHRQALVEGRAVRITFKDAVLGTSSRSVVTFPTREEALADLESCRKAGLVAEHLQVSLEDQARNLGLPCVPESWLVD